MELQNVSIKKSKHTCRFTALHTRKIGLKPYTQWNSLTTTDDMQTEINVRRIPSGNTLVIRKHKIPIDWRKDETLLRNREEALAAHELARNRIADRRKSTFTLFKRGDQVWLDSQNLKTTYHKKMKPKREGPFTTVPFHSISRSRITRTFGFTKGIACHAVMGKMSKWFWG